MSNFSIHSSKVQPLKTELLTQYVFIIFQRSRMGIIRETSTAKGRSRARAKRRGRCANCQESLKPALRIETSFRMPQQKYSRTNYIVY